jgi:NAD+ synthase
VLQLAVNALGPKKVLGILMPSGTTPAEDTADAIAHARVLGIRYLAIDIDPLLEKYAEFLPANERAKGNLMARVRMNILYYHAGVNSYLVAGTSDRSEYEIGFFTKWGDGAADIMPIADLYKTQVRELARHLKIPKEIIDKKSSPRLWDNHLAEEEIGIDYETIDRILRLKNNRPNVISKKLGISPRKVRKIMDMVEKSRHKRDRPPSPG